MKRICIYGKGGIGKSTVVTNLAAAMSDLGLKVAVVGCDPKADSTRCLTGERIPTVLGQLQKGQHPPIAFKGYHDILCIEAGGPEPGTGCAGRGIVAALSEIREQNLLAHCDVVIYDVLGDVVCGGFSMPLREGIAETVCIVTTSDFMALYAANNISRGIKKYAQSGSVRLAGFICNGRSSVDSPELVEEFSQSLGASVLGRIPASSDIGVAEVNRKTLVEFMPNHAVSNDFRKLADVLLNNPPAVIPTPLLDEEVEELCRHHLSNHR